MYSKFPFLILLLISILLLENCASTTPVEEQPYTISGKVDSLFENREVILSQYDPVKQVKTPLDTAEIADDGTYALAFEWTAPDLFRVDFSRKQYAMLVIDKGQNNIKLDVEGVRNGKVAVEGSEDAQKLLGYEQFRINSYNTVVKPTYDAMRAATKEDDREAEIEAVEKYAHASEKSRKQLIDYTVENIGTSIALYGTMLRWTGDEEIAKLEDLVNKFKAAHPDLKMTTTMVDKVTRFKKVALGAKASEINQPDTTGTMVSLYASKGKYTLVDFWASWCTPCLLQIPDLKEAYKNFHDKGFEIVGVSVDSKADRWKKAIVKYEMDWVNVSDVKGWASQPAADYNVTFIPFNVLLDPEGKIIAKNLHSKSLQGKLEELFVAL